jgi:hypothetical protein
VATASEYDIALSMTRLWGNEANNLARKYACEYVRLNDFKKAANWYDVQRTIGRLQRVQQRFSGFPV